MKSRFFLIAILSIAACSVFYSCTQEEEIVEVDVNDYTYYFLVDGKKYKPDETIYIDHAPDKAHKIELLTEEGGKHLWYPNVDSYEIIWWDEDDSFNPVFYGYNVGTVRSRFTIGNIYNPTAPNSNEENFLYTKNTKNIYLNIVVKAMPDEVIKMNMDINVKNEFSGNEFGKDYYQTFIRLEANGVTKPLCFNGNMKIEAWGDYEKPGYREEEYIPQIEYPNTNYSPWRQNDKYAYFDAYIRGPIRLCYVGQYWPKNYYIIFSYAGKTYKLEKTSSSSVPVWTIE